MPAIAAHLGGLPRTFWLLWLGTIVNRLGSFILPMMQLYLTSKRGLTIPQASLLISLYGFGCFFANPLGGWMADRFGRKPTMIIGLVLAAAAMLGIGFARDVNELIVAMAFFGLVNDIYRPASMALLSDVVKPEDRVRAFTHLYWAFNLGAAVAPPIAGYFADRDLFQALFIGDAATTLLLALIIFSFIPETKPKDAGPRESTWKGLSAPFTDKAYLPYLGVCFLLSLVFFQFLVAMPADMNAHGFTKTQIGWAFGLNGLLIILVQPFTAKSIALGNRAKVLATASLLIGAGFGVYAFAGERVSVWLLGVVLWTAGEILMSPVNSSIVADMSPDHQRGRYQGAYAMAWSVAWIVAPLAGGHGPTGLGTKAFWGACFVIGVVTALLQLAIAPARRRRMLELHGKALSD